MALGGIFASRGLLAAHEWRSTLSISFVPLMLAVLALALTRWVKFAQSPDPVGTP